MKKQTIEEQTSRIKNMMGITEQITKVTPTQNPQIDSIVKQCITQILKTNDVIKYPNCVKIGTFIANNGKSKIDSNIATDTNMHVAVEVCKKEIGGNPMEASQKLMTILNCISKKTNQPTFDGDGMIKSIKTL